MTGPEPTPAPKRVPPAYYVLFLALYAIQGIVYAYFINFNQAYMMAAGVSAESAAWLQSLALLPFAFKFLAGPLSDRFSPFGWGRRRPYILLGLVLQSAGLIGLSRVDPGRSLQGFLVLAVLTVVGLALYDTVCDGMVIDVTPPDDRERVQGSLIGARFLAATVCSLGFGFWLRATGNGPGKGTGVLWTCAALAIVPLVLTWLAREPARAADAETFRWSALKVLLRPRSLCLLAFGALYSTVSYGVEINLPPFYETLGFDEGDFGAFGAARNVGRAVGAFFFPMLSPRIGRARTLLLGLAALSATSALHATAAGWGWTAALGLAFGAANGWADAVFYVLAMEAADPRMAASTYALFMAVSNLSLATGGLFGTGVQLWGGQYRPMFLLWPILTLTAAALVPALSRPRAQPAPALATPGETDADAALV